MPARPSGTPPQLDIELSSNEGKAPLQIAAHARVIEKSAPVFYTFGTDNSGIYRNALVAWELYGPGDADYRFLQPPALRPDVARTAASLEVTVTFTLHRAGKYRLRATTVDMAGRTTVKWIPLIATE